VERIHALSKLFGALRTPLKRGRNELP